MSTTFLRDFERDPAKTIRQRLQQAWAQMERDAEQSRRTNEQMKYAASYAQRHPIKPNTPDAA